MNKKQLEIIREVHNFVKQESVGFAEDDIFTNHILNVKNCAQKLAKFYRANEFVVVLAAYLHDIYYLQTRNHEIHEIKGAEFSVEYLKKFPLSREEITAVGLCIINHRGSKKAKRNSIEEQIIACADAIDHIRRWLSMFYRLSKERSYEEAAEWMSKKLDRGYAKISLPYAKNMIKDKYLAAKLSLSAR